MMTINLSSSNFLSPPVPTKNPVVQFKTTMTTNLSFSSFPSPVPTFSVLHSSSFSSSPTQTIASKYLITRCHFSSVNATEISKQTSTDKRDSVVHLLKQHGFNDANIRKVISCYPRILSCDITRTLEPNLNAIVKMGFTRADLQQLLTINPTILLRCSYIARLEFWLSFMKNNKKHLISRFGRNPNLISSAVSKVIIPNIALLKEHGFSECDIQMIVKFGPRLVTRNADSIQLLLKRARELGFSPASKMFVHGLVFLSSVSSVTFHAKMEFYKSIGWSEMEFLAAFQKTPSLIKYSEENVWEKMEFLVGKVGCTESYIASHPLLLSFSLEKRLKPRYNVVEILKSNGLVGRERDLCNIMCFPEKKFVEKFILPYEERSPELVETYIASGGKVLV